MESDGLVGRRWSEKFEAIAGDDDKERKEEEERKSSLTAKGSAK